MTNMVKQKRGQFIIIAALLVAIMMVSIGVIMYSAVTYYRHERWEEYVATIDDVKTGSRRVVEISLANYTLNNCTNNLILRNNLNQWINDIKKAYAGFGVIVSYYDDQLSGDWHMNASLSEASATFTLDITSAGLTGYTFTAPISLRMKILNAVCYNSTKELTITLTVDKEDLMPVTDLNKESFSVLVTNGTVQLLYLPNDFTLTRYYSELYDSIVYDIYCITDTIEPIGNWTVSVTVIDARSIKVIADSAVTIQL